MEKIVLAITTFFIPGLAQLIIGRTTTGILLMAIAIPNTGDHNGSTRTPQK